MSSHESFLKEQLLIVSGIARESFGKVSGITKPEDNNQVLTETDLKIGSHLITVIKSQFPTYNIIDEEAGVIDNNSEFTWVVDPIDGTSNFANGIPTYGIIIGLLERNTPIAGGIALPFFDEILIAEKGQGAFLNGKRIDITDSSNLKSALISYGIDGHPEEPTITEEESRILGKIVLNIRNLRTSNSVFDAVMVAKGSYGAFINRTSKIWDNVGQQIVIEEAGGVYTDYYGNPMDYSNPLSKAKQNFSFCFGSPSIHRSLMEIINKDE